MVCFNSSVIHFVIKNKKRTTFLKAYFNGWLYFLFLINEFLMHFRAYILICAGKMACGENAILRMAPDLWFITPKWLPFSLFFSQDYLNLEQRSIREECIYCSKLFVFFLNLFYLHTYIKIHRIRHDVTRLKVVISNYYNLYLYIRFSYSVNCVCVYVCVFCANYKVIMTIYYMIFSEINDKITTKITFLT